MRPRFTPYPAAGPSRVGRRRRRPGYGVDERQRRRLDGIGRHAAAAVDRAVALDFDRRFALGIFAARHAVDAEVADHDRDAGDLLDRAEQRVERAVAAG